MDSGTFAQVDFSYIIGWVSNIQLILNNNVVSVLGAVCNVSFYRFIITNGEQRVNLYLNYSGFSILYKEGDEHHKKQKKHGEKGNRNKHAHGYVACAGVCNKHFVVIILLKAPLFICGCIINIYIVLDVETFMSCVQ
ncbi:hypothetical protein XENTR_v10011142 [Xenopus tropicalis]|nr:hypothetical protein XENTR_v10011142 [Xenopus tropicalis]